MIYFKLAIKSLFNRRFTSILTVLSIALSVALFLGVERVRSGARESFSNTISKTHLIVGARGSPIQLLLYSVFRMGNATNNIDWKTYQKYASRPDVEWTIPISLGDSHMGFRVVATDHNFYEHYRFRGTESIAFAEGKAPNDVFEVAIGAEAARELKYKIGDAVVVTHGVTDGPGIINHSDKPFTLVGILDRTGTPADRSVYITLEGMEAIHMDWGDGAPPMPGQEIKASTIHKEDVRIGQITSFLMRLKSFPTILTLQREINNDTSEPLMSIIPGVTLDELWRTISYGEDALRVVSGFVVIVGLLGMLVTLYTSVNERRREMSILRAIGARPRTLITLLVTESWLLGSAGALVGTGFMYIFFILIQPYVAREFGLMLPVKILSELEFVMLGGVSLLSMLVGFVPAWRAYRNSLADGLVARV
jgi:putative ABC transport system permease protein